MSTVEARLFLGVVGGTSKVPSVLLVPSIRVSSTRGSAVGSPIDSLSDPDVYTKDGVEELDDRCALCDFLGYRGIWEGSSGMGLCGCEVEDT